MICVSNRHLCDFSEAKYLSYGKFAEHQTKFSIELHVLIWTLSLKHLGNFRNRIFFATLLLKKISWIYATTITVDLLFFGNSNFTLGTNCQNILDFFLWKFQIVDIRISVLLRNYQRTWICKHFRNTYNWFLS